MCRSGRSTAGLPVGRRDRRDPHGRPAGRITGDGWRDQPLRRLPLKRKHRGGCGWKPCRLGVRAPSGSCAGAAATASRRRAVCDGRRDEVHGRGAGETSHARAEGEGGGSRRRGHEGERVAGSDLDDRDSARVGDGSGAASCSSWFPGGGTASTGATGSSDESAATAVIAKRRRNRERRSQAFSFSPFAFRSFPARSCSVPAIAGEFFLY